MNRMMAALVLMIVVGLADGYGASTMGRILIRIETSRNATWHCPVQCLPLTNSPYERRTLCWAKKVLSPHLSVWRMFFGTPVAGDDPVGIGLLRA